MLLRRSVCPSAHLNLSANFEVYTPEFTDDNYNNCLKAQELGWNAAHLVEDGAVSPKNSACQFQIRDILELREVFPLVFQDVC